MLVPLDARVKQSRQNLRRRSSSHRWHSRGYGRYCRREANARRGNRHAGRSRALQVADYGALTESGGGKELPPTESQSGGSGPPPRSDATVGFDSSRGEPGTLLSPLW